MNLFRGLYRTTAWAYVTNDTMAFNVPEAEYRAFRYEPDYDSLPWKESFVAAKSLFDCSDVEWLAILRRSVMEEVIKGVKFPRFPDTILQSNFVGSANESALQEAYNFYSLLKDRSTKLNSPVAKDSRVLDFGCGWGRFLRFFWKGVNVANLHGVDVDPDIIEVCRNAAVPGTFYELEANGRLPFSDGYFSHVLAYSVFTHLPEKVHLHWLAEIARVMQSQATFCLTLQPRRFLDFVAGLDQSPAESSWHKNLGRFANSVVPLKQAYDSGQFVYLPSGGGNYRDADVYGEAVVPLPYIEKNWKKYLYISEYIDDPVRFWQAVLIAQKL
jgi:ubiquinone/menaquinone biosynthesis C-methylase UbiE